jgi:F420-0:gamma-glutamyl ligase
MSTHKLRAIYKQLTDKIEDSKERALFEVKELKNDLNELQRHLSGRKKETDIQPDDILRSAYEISHRLREMYKRQEILAEMEDVAAETEALEYLDSRGAKLLTRPAGWHFQTSTERFLLDPEDPVRAAAELRKLLAAGKRLKRPAKKKKQG